MFSIGMRISLLTRTSIGLSSRFLSGLLKGCIPIPHPCTNIEHIIARKVFCLWTVSRSKVSWNLSIIPLITLLSLSNRSSSGSIFTRR